jgi:hypothetical protein
MVVWIAATKSYQVFCTTCRKGAKVYDKNYVVLLAEV